MFETLTNWSVKSSPAVNLGRGTPTEPREVWTLFATPILGLNCALTNSMVKIGGSEGVLVQVTTLVTFPSQWVGVLTVNDREEPAKAARVRREDVNIAVDWKGNAVWERGRFPCQIYICTQDSVHFVFI